MSQVCGPRGRLYGGMLMEEAPVSALFASPRQPYTRALARLRAAALRCARRDQLDRRLAAGRGTAWAGLSVRAALCACRSRNAPSARRSACSASRRVACWRAEG
jgi:ABC-type dipeptide/oligopeptide/nickel transport system ATPase component